MQLQPGFSPKCLDWMVAVFQECVELWMFHGLIFLSLPFKMRVLLNVSSLIAVRSNAFSELRSWKSTLPSTKRSIGTDCPNVCSLVQFEFWSAFWRKWPTMGQTGWYLQGGGHSLTRRPVSWLCAWGYIFVSRWKVKVLCDQPSALNGHLNYMPFCHCLDDTFTGEALHTFAPDFLNHPVPMSLNFWCYFKLDPGFGGAAENAVSNSAAQSELWLFCFLLLALLDASA